MLACVLSCLSFQMFDRDIFRELREIFSGSFVNFSVTPFIYSEKLNVGFLSQCLILSVFAYSAPALSPRPLLQHRGIPHYAPNSPGRFIWPRLHTFCSSTHSSPCLLTCDASSGSSFVHTFITERLSSPRPASLTWEHLQISTPQHGAPQRKCG